MKLNVEADGSIKEDVQQYTSAFFKRILLVLINTVKVAIMVVVDVVKSAAELLTGTKFAVVMDRIVYKIVTSTTSQNRNLHLIFFLTAKKLSRFEKKIMTNSNF